MDGRSSYSYSPIRSSIQGRGGFADYEQAQGGESGDRESLIGTAEERQRQQQQQQQPGSAPSTSAAAALGPAASLASPVANDEHA